MPDTHAPQPIHVPDEWLLAAAIEAHNDGRDQLADFDGEYLEYLSDAIAAVIPLVRAAQDAEVERLRAQVAAYESAITWGTTCTRHAELLTECRRQEERAERAEVALGRARDLCARSPLCVPSEERP